MKPIYLLSFFLILCFSMNAEAYSLPNAQARDSVSLKKLLKQIADDNVFELPGESANSSPQILRAQQMAKSASPYDLLKISMENTNPVVRLYAFMNLASRMDNIPAEVAKKFKEDMTIISFKTPKGEIRKLSISSVANGFLK